MTNQSKHTAGPWKIKGFFITAQHGNRENSVVADIDRHAWLSEGEAQANARLIASAPELLEALKEVRVLCCKYAMDTSLCLEGRPMGELINKTVTLIDKEIAKAEGKSQC